MRSVLRRFGLVFTSCALAFALTATASPVAAAAPTPVPFEIVVPVSEHPPLGADGKPVLENQTEALPAIVVAAAGWCASGALGGVSTQVLLDIYNGKASSRTAYVENAVVSCIVGNIGGWAWRVIPAAAKRTAIRAVISFVIYVARAR